MTEAKKDLNKDGFEKGKLLTQAEQLQLKAKQREERSKAEKAAAAKTAKTSS